MAPFMKHYSILFVVLITFLTTGVMLERIETSDFKVYYGATRDFYELPDSSNVYGSEHKINGKVYDKPYGLSSGFFKYAPVTLFFFTPLAILPFEVAQIIYLGLLALSLLLLIHISTGLVQKFINIDVKSPLSIVLLALLFTGVHLHREFLLGNINIITMLLVMAAVHLSLSIRKRDTIIAGFMMAVTIQLKLHFIVLLPVVLLFKQTRLLLYSIAFLFFLSFLPVLVLGYDTRSDLYSRWFKAVSYLGLLIYQYTRMITPSEPNQQSNLFVLNILVVVAAVPAVTLTDTNHFLFSLPMIVFLLSLQHQLKTTENVMLFAALFIYGGNIYDIWGRTMSLWLHQNGFLLWGNLSLILIFIYSFFFRNNTDQNSVNWQ